MTDTPQRQKLMCHMTSKAMAANLELAVEDIEIDGYGGPKPTGEVMVTVWCTPTEPEPEPTQVGH